jgi:hypothetical protein
MLISMCSDSLIKWPHWREIIKESTILITTLETRGEKIYDLKTGDSSRDTVRLGTQGQTLQWK